MPMNIVFISQLIPIPNSENRISKALLDFLEDWKASHQLKVIRPTFRYEKLDLPETQKYIINNVEVEIIKPLRIPLLKWSYHPIKKVINELPFEPDIVVCHLYNSYFSFARLAKKLNVPLVVGVHMSDIVISKKWLYRKMQSHVFRNVSGFACRSFAIQKQFIRSFPQYKNKCFTSISGLPTTFFENIDTIKSGISSTESIVKIITVASLIKLKHIDRVIQALSGTKNRNWTYTIIGSGPEEERLKQLVRNMDLEDSIRFTGFLDRKEVFEQLKKHDVFILPSYPETLGLVYLEAMAAGNLVICAKGWGVDGIIKDEENGFTCNAERSEDIRHVLEKVLKLTTEEKTKIQERSLQTLKSYSTNNMANLYMSNLNRIVENFERH